MLASRPASRSSFHWDTEIKGPGGGRQRGAREEEKRRRYEVGGQQGSFLARSRLPRPGTSSKDRGGRDKWLLDPFLIRRSLWWRIPRALARGDPEEKTCWIRCPPTTASNACVMLHQRGSRLERDPVERAAGGVRSVPTPKLISTTRLRWLLAHRARLIWDRLHRPLRIGRVTWKRHACVWREPGRH